MLKFLSALLQFVLYLATFALGSFFLHPFNRRTILTADATHTRIFIWDGLLLMLLLDALVLLIEALMKQLRRAAPWSTAAVLLAGALGLFMKFGFLTLDR
jgi:hypothetical protein